MSNTNSQEINKSENQEKSEERLISEDPEDHTKLADDFYGDDARNPKYKKPEGEYTSEVIEEEDFELRHIQQIKASSTPPMSPGKRVLRVVTSPGRFVKTTLREGSVNSSVFSLVIVCLGAGTLTIPNIMYDNGFVFGSLLILFGGFLSAFSGYLIAYCAHKTNGACFEEIALAIYGKKMMKFTAYCMLPCNGGFLASYFVVFKTYMPYSIEKASGKTLPSWCGDSIGGQAFWVLVLYVAIIPMTLQRKLASVRYASLFSVLLSFYLVLVIIVEAVLDNGSSPTMKAGLEAGSEKAQISLLGFCNSLSIIIFAFMYQVNIPALYNELENKSLPNIRNVVIIGTILACCLYICAGIFGYLSFACSDQEELDRIFSDNILKAPYHTSTSTTDIPIVIYISLFGMCIVVSIATPFCVLPMKDGVEENRNKKFTKGENVFYTLLLAAIPAICALPFKSISTPMAILGATTNSAVGFFFPIMFYLRLEKKQSAWTNMKIMSYLIFGFVALSSVVEIILLIISFF